MCLKASIPSFSSHIQRPQSWIQMSISASSGNIVAKKVHVNQFMENIVFLWRSLWNAFQSEYEDLSDLFQSFENEDSLKKNFEVVFLFSSKFLFFIFFLFSSRANKFFFHNFLIFFWFRF